jgi:16S rRNA (adenine1518-N6/adenine1519-N6)-dimethyltransferase
MNIQEQTLQICKANGIKPQRSKGQNFLIEEKFYDEVVQAAELTKLDKVLEVGPGLGFLTAKLAEKAGSVTAVELDNKLAELLKIRLKKEKITNISVMNGNALDLQVDKQGKYKIVANLPYNITSAFLRKFLSQAKQKPELMVLLLQKEVAERICAQPGQMSLLAVSVQVYAEAEIIDLVPAKAFFPAPEVESAIIRIKVRESKIKEAEEKAFFQLVRIGFSAKRKKLSHNLSAGFRIPQAEASTWLASSGFGDNARAQELGVDDWITLLSKKSVN